MSDASTDLLDDNSRVFNFLDSDLFTASNVTLTGLTITGGRATAGENGGGIQFNSSGTLTLNESTVGGNISADSSVGGGGIYAGFGDVSLNNSSVIGNIGDEDGGGIRTIFGNLSLTNSTVSGNISGSDGGGISTSFADITLINSTISGNIGGRDGGGIGFNDSNIILVNSTVTANSATRMGGGISFRSDSSFQEDSLTLRNSIVAGNTDDGAAPDVLASGDAIDLIVEHSLIGDTTGLEITATSGVGNVLNRSALLGPLADNGGPTLTHALLLGSPAIDAGSNALAIDANGDPLTTDQRGEARIQFGTVDIGAVESEIEDQFLLGDTNLDGDINFLDISPFISLLASGTFLDEADINRDGNVDFLDIGPFISLLASGGFEDPFILGDANLDGVVDFSDISPFISLLSSGSFLDEADINRDGNVDFSDIGLFIPLLASSGSAQGKQFVGSPDNPSITSGSSEKSGTAGIEPSVSSAVSVSKAQSNGSIAARTEDPIATVTFKAQESDALSSRELSNLQVTSFTTNGPLVFVDDPVADAGDLSVIDAMVDNVGPVDALRGPVTFALTNYSFAGDRNFSAKAVKNNRPLVTQQSRTSNAEPRDSSLGLRGSLATRSTTNVSTKDSFSTAAELFDAHPESLDEVFDFELEETFAELID